jgi:hypothetical protein
MRKRWCHDHKLGHQTTGNASIIWSDEAPKEAYNPGCLVPTVKNWVGAVMVWAAVSWYRDLLVPLLLSPASTVTRFEHHQTTLVGFGD